MIAAPPQPATRPQRRWLITVLLVFAAQLGLIFGLSDKTRPRARSSVSRASLRLAAPGSNEVLALMDPTWFALPHRQSFSGPAWMTIPALPTNAFSWSEELRPLGLRTQDLGAAFNRFVATNDFAGFQTLAPPEPALALPAVTPWAVASNSSLRIEGRLAQRRLLTPLNLPPWSHTDLLTNTVVQVLVDAEGRPVSGGILLSSSGSQLADQHALEQVLAARFNSVADGSATGPADRLTWGTLIFEWKNVPEPVTNTAPAGAAAHP